jgi:hypothetical protein
VTAPRPLAQLVGWRITDHDAPDHASTVTAVREAADRVYFDTAAGWSFGGKRDHLVVSDRGGHVVVSITPFLVATLEPPEVSA